MLPDPPNRYAHLHVRERAFAHYYHPATILFFPSQLKILYETLLIVCKYRVGRQKVLSGGCGLIDFAGAGLLTSLPSVLHKILQLFSPNFLTCVPVSVVCVGGRSPSTVVTSVTSC